MEVKDTLTAALKAVTDAEIPEDLREVAFDKAIDLIAGSTAVSSPPSPSRPGPAQPAASPAPTAGVADDMLSRIAERLGVSREVIGEVFDAKDGSIDITVAHGKLAKAKMVATQELALLVAAGRQAAGLEKRTNLNSIRATCEEYRRYDQANFSAAIKKMEDEFSPQKAGNTRTVKLTRQGWTKATDLVKRLSGEADA